MENVLSSLLQLPPLLPAGNALSLLSLSRSLSRARARALSLLSLHQPLQISLRLLHLDFCEMEWDRGALAIRTVPNLMTFHFALPDPASHDGLWRRAGLANLDCGSAMSSITNFASLSLSEKRERSDYEPTAAQLLKHPLAVLAYVPKDAVLFLAGAVAGAAAKSVTAPLDRIKLLMQVAHLFSNRPVCLF